MKMFVSVVQDRRETWFKGTKDEVPKRVFTLLDMDPVEGRQMSKTMDYRPSPEECVAFADGALLLKPVTIAVGDIVPGKNGRIVVAGSIIEPKLNGNGAVKKNLVG